MDIILLSHSSKLSLSLKNNENFYCNLAYNLLFKNTKCISYTGLCGEAGNQPHPNCLLTKKTIFLLTTIKSTLRKEVRIKLFFNLLTNLIVVKI